MFFFYLINPCLLKLPTSINFRKLWQKWHRDISHANRSTVFFSPLRIWNDAVFERKQKDCHVPGLWRCTLVLDQGFISPSPPFLQYFTACSLELKPSPWKFAVGVWNQEKRESVKSGENETTRFLKASRGSGWMQERAWMWKSACPSHWGVDLFWIIPLTRYYRVHDLGIAKETLCNFPSYPCELLLGAPISSHLRKNMD